MLLRWQFQSSYGHQRSGRYCRQFEDIDRSNAHGVLWTRGVIQDLALFRVISIVRPWRLITPVGRLGFRQEQVVLGRFFGNKRRLREVWAPCRVAIQSGSRDKFGWCGLLGYRVSPLKRITPQRITPQGITPFFGHPMRACVFYDLIPADSDILVVAAVAINDRGQIAAFGGPRSTYDHDLPISIYLLTPAP